MNYSQTLAWLFAQLPMFQRVGAPAFKADISKTQALMRHLGHPEHGLTSVHVGGTNGKGSVAHMLAALFQAAGFRTGLYTSPHLVDFRERIRIDGSMIPKDRVVEFVGKHRAFFTENPFSFFEMTVGLALDYFRAAEVDLAVIEVGMGGRLDSTNVITPQLSVITNVSFDHMQFLGNTLSAIAREKAGIIKPGIPALIGRRHPETDPVFKHKAAEVKAPIFFAPDWKETDVNWPTDLKGSYQRENLRTVRAAVELLEDQGYPLAKHAPRALQQVAALTGLRGRWEKLGEAPKIIADVGHNEEGIASIVESLKKERYRKLHLVWGTVKDKDLAGILPKLPREGYFYLSKPEVPRGLEATELAAAMKEFGFEHLLLFDSVSKALADAKRRAQADDLILIGGSTFVVAEGLQHYPQASEPK